MANVVFSFLGTTLDKGSGEKRWSRWRPTVALVGQKHCPIDRIELFLTSPVHLELAQSVAKDIAEKAPDTQINSHVLDITDPWDFQSVYSALDDYSKSYVFDEKDQYFVHLATGSHVAQICLFLLTQARKFPAKLLDTFSHVKDDTAEAWRGSSTVIDLELQAYDGLQERLALDRADSTEYLKGGIATANRAFNELISAVEKVGVRSKAPILLMGPTGAGKSQLARRIFELRRHRHLIKGEFVDVNCATLQGIHAQSTLFGHKKGAFTGATDSRAGLLKAADSGVLFLDEIGELGLDEQTMLLKALEDKAYYPLGSETKMHSDFLLIAGTNRDLAKMVKEGRFRADLYSRINLWTFVLPGLKDRVEDIEPNLQYECEQASKAVGKKVSFSDKALELYLEFSKKAPWPGNFRDLSASVLRMATLADGARLTISDVSREIERLNQVWGSDLSKNVSTSTRDWVALLNLKVDPFDHAQLNYVLEVLSRSKNLAQAGRELFQISRTNKSSFNDSDRIKKYLAKYGVSMEDVKRLS